MNALFFVCGVLRVIVPAVFTTMAFTVPSLGLVLAGPFGACVVLVALYDARERRRRRER